MAPPLPAPAPARAPTGTSRGTPRLWGLARALRVVGVGVGVTGLLLACVSPTLPLPPPELPSITQGSAPDRFVLTAGKGGAEPDAFIIALNLNPSLPRDRRVTGTQADEEGKWRMEVWGRPGDRIDITQEVGTTRSPSLSVTIPR